MSGPLYTGGRNWQNEASRLRQAGVSLPQSSTQARAEAINMRTAVNNKTLIASMNRSRLANYRGRQITGGFGSNMQIAMPKIRQPLGTLADKGVPFNVEDDDELKEIRRWCNTPDAPVWMADYTFKSIGDITPGEQVIGWETETEGRRETRRLTKSTVLATNRRMAPEVVRVTLESGRVMECTPDHEWLRYTRKDHGKWVASEYGPAEVGTVLRNVVEPTLPLDSPEKIRAAHWLAGIIDADGSASGWCMTLNQSAKVNQAVVDRIDETIRLLDLDATRVVINDSRPNNYGYPTENMVRWTFKGRQQIVDLLNWAHPAKLDVEFMDRRMLTTRFGTPDRVVSVESLGPGEVVSMQTTTGNYTAWGTASRNCRLFFSTHDLVPLLIDIYSKFPLVGMEFDARDPLIKRFYEDMFFGPDLNYLEFLPDQFAREYFTVGEVTSLAHFNESLGIWSSEEILNPDMLRVSRSLFVQRDRVQLMVKDLVDNLRQGPMSGASMGNDDETPSERLERNKEYSDLVRFYPEIIQAAAQNDGLDIADALISRVVNRATPWAKRGTPHLLRSFRTLMMEESLLAAQDAVADRLYSPLVLATLGIEDMGDGEPWIPDQSELDDTRDDMQSALAADFRLMVHNFGLKVENVFGRESVPNLDSDFDRVQAKLLQSWGIGAALISGGDGGAYASSALNREFVTQMMVGFQNSVRRHILKRAEVIAEAQGHYDYDLKGGVRIPIYREIVETDPETGQEVIRKVPKLLVPDVKFQSLNLRDEAQERAFVAQLKAMGVPISDKTLAINIDVEFDQELERQAEESVAKLMATAQAMKKVQDLCDQQNLPYPPELAQHLMSTLQLRQGKSQTELGEAQAEVGEAQAQLQEEQIEIQQMMLDQQMAGGMMPGQPMMPPGAAGPPPGAPGEAPPPGEEDPGAAPAGDPGGAPPAAPGPGAPGPGNAPAGYYAAAKKAGLDVNGPQATGPAGSPPSGPLGPDLPPGVQQPTEVPRNRQRPAESDEQQGSQPKQVGASRRKRTRKGEETPRRLSKFEKGPSSYGKSHTASEEDVTNQVRRLETVASWDTGRSPRVADLVKDPRFYQATNMQAYESQIKGDFPAILAGEAPESKAILEDMLYQFYEIFRTQPIW